VLIKKVIHNLFKKIIPEDQNVVRPKTLKR